MTQGLVSNAVLGFSNGTFPFYVFILTFYMLLLSLQSRQEPVVCFQNNLNTTFFVEAVRQIALHCAIIVIHMTETDILQKL